MKPAFILLEQLLRDARIGAGDERPHFFFWLPGRRCRRHGLNDRSSLFRPNRFCGSRLEYFPQQIYHRHMETYSQNLAWATVELGWEPDETVPDRIRYLVQVPNSRLNLNGLFKVENINDAYKKFSIAGQKIGAFRVRTASVKIASHQEMSLWDNPQIWAAPPEKDPRLYVAGQAPADVPVQLFKIGLKLGWAPQPDMPPIFAGLRQYIESGVWIEAPIRAKSDGEAQTAFEEFRRPQAGYWFVRVLNVVPCQEWEVRDYSRRRSFSDEDLTKLGVLKI
jgi:hypothetical protein